MQGNPLSYSNIQWFGGPQLFPKIWILYALEFI